jgi:hypothetical protein
MDTLNALVVQSVVQPGGMESLTLVYLDPAASSPLLSGMNVQKAIATAFVVPLTEGKTYGWKELPETNESRDKALQDLADAGARKPTAAELDADAAEKKAAAATAAADDALGVVPPGDPDSPHAIDIGGQPGEPQPDGGTYLPGVAGTASPEPGSTSDNPLPG